MGALAPASPVGVAGSQSARTCAPTCYQQIDGIEAQLEEHRRAKAAADAEDRDYARYESALLHDVQVAELEQERSDLLERLAVAMENKKLVRAQPAPAVTAHGLPVTHHAPVPLFLRLFLLCVQARARRVREKDAAADARRAELDQVRAARDSPFLTESRILAHNFDDPRRVRRDHYKGMSQEQLAAIRAEQEAQRRELEARRAAAKREEAE